MATINFAITGISEGSIWSGRINTAGAGNAVVSTDLSGLSVDLLSPLTNNFTVDSSNGFKLYSGSGTKYVTWRSQNISTQFPTTGESIDIWSDTLYDAIFAGASWNTLIGNSYNLLTNKWSLYYDYSIPATFAYSRGGSITFS